VSEGHSEGHSDSTGDRRDRIFVDVLLYAAARLLLVAVLTGAIYGVARLLGVTQFPVVVAVLFALIIGMPLGIWLFTPLRRRATAGLAIAGERRRRERENLRARLRGESPTEERPDAD
jgi:small-conductance mechanosensitive channel